MPYKTKEERKEYYKNYRENNKEKIKIKKREYNQSEKGKKTNTLISWKQMGLLCSSKEEYEQIYNRWLNSEKCEKKGCEYEEDNIKHMDHDHSTGLFRNILCHRCNSNDNSSNTSGTPNIYYEKNSDGWRYGRTFKKKTHRKYFKTKEEAIAYKMSYESNFNKNEASEPSSIV